MAGEGSGNLEELTKAADAAEGQAAQPGRSGEKKNAYILPLIQPLVFEPVYKLASYIRTVVDEFSDAIYYRGLVPAYSMASTVLSKAPAAGGEAEQKE